MTTDTVSLTALPRELIALTGGPSPNYRRLWNLVVEGHLPAEMVGGRYQIKRADLPAIATTLGLVSNRSTRVAA